MPADDWKRASRLDWLFAAALIAAGTAISALSIGEIKANGQFDIVWQTPGLVEPEAFSHYLKAPTAAP